MRIFNRLIENPNIQTYSAKARERRRQTVNTTHEIFNQPTPLENYNLFTGNQALRDALKFNAPPASCCSPSWSHPSCAPSP